MVKVTEQAEVELKKALDENKADILRLVVNGFG